MNFFGTFRFFCLKKVPQSVIYRRPVKHRPNPEWEIFVKWRKVRPHPPTTCYKKNIEVLGRVGERERGRKKIELKKSLWTFLPLSDLIFFNPLQSWEQKMWTAADIEMLIEFLLLPSKKIYKKQLINKKYKSKTFRTRKFRVL